MSDKKQYMLLLGGTGEGVANMPEDERNAHMQLWETWFEDLGKRGILLDGNPFSPESVVIAGKEKSQKAGFFAGSKEQAFGGYVIVQADSDEHAAEIVKECPTFELEGSIELREITEM